jgi:nitrite reductase/ring-hydroxylating ferredoxin subunit
VSGPGDGFVAVGPARELRAGYGRVYELDGTPVAVFRTEDGWAAIGDTCPHMGTSLSGGKVRDGIVECPWHHWRFDLATGRSTARDWACVPVYEVAVHDGRLWLKPPPQRAPEPVRDDEDDDDAWMRADPETFFKKPRP